LIESLIEQLLDGIVAGVAVRDAKMNLSILVILGKENNNDFISIGERR